MNSYYYDYGYRNYRFKEVYKDYEEFKTNMQNEEIPLKITLDNLKTLYYMLLAKHANDILINSSVDQFKRKVQTIIFMYGPTWEKKLEIQDKIRNLTDEELLQGSTRISNSAMHPQDGPNTMTDDPVDYLDSQAISKFKKGKLDGYAYLWDLLATDVTRDFLKRFDKLFDPNIQPDCPLYYCNNENLTEEI